MPINFATTALDDALRAAGFDFAAPAFFSWLGVVPYLERPAIDQTLAFIASLPTQTAVVFDYAVPPESLGGVSRMAFLRMADRVAAVGEPWKTFFDPQSLSNDLQKLGFSGVEDFDGDGLNHRFFAGRSDGVKVGSSGHIAFARV